MTYTRLTSPDGIDYWRVDPDMYGNPRYVVHFLDVLPESQSGFDAARANVPGGKSYRAKWFGGGIVFRSYLGDSGVGRWLDSLTH